MVQFARILGVVEVISDHVAPQNEPGLATATNVVDCPIRGSSALGKASASGEVCGRYREKSGGRIDADRAPRSRAERDVATARTGAHRALPSARENR
jgi:hypothetical protein